MASVYIEQDGIPPLPCSLVFWPNYRFPLSEKRLFLRDIMAVYEQPFFSIAQHIEEADFVAVPFEYFDVLDRHGSYLQHVYAVAKKAGKKVLLFDYTDYVDRDSVLPPEAVLFRVSVYRHHQKKNEIVMRYFVEDIGSRYGIEPKHKSSAPTVGYCGYARFGSALRRIRAEVKRVLQLCMLVLYFDPIPFVHQRGMFWRTKAITILRASGLPHAIIERPFYSGHRASVTTSPDSIRREYVENLRECDMALSVRGDANASQRFYEILSAGRIPLFLDTDCVLPLQESIRYDDCMIRVSSKDVSLLGKKATSWYAGRSELELLEAQEKSRKFFQEYLRLDRYFDIVFNRARSPYVTLLFS